MRCDTEVAKPWGSGYGHCGCQSLLRRRGRPAALMTCPCLRLYWWDLGEGPQGVVPRRIVRTWSSLQLRRDLEVTVALLWVASFEVTTLEEMSLEPFIFEHDRLFLGAMDVSEMLPRLKPRVREFRSVATQRWRRSRAPRLRKGFSGLFRFATSILPMSSVLCVLIGLSALNPIHENSDTSCSAS